MAEVQLDLEYDVSCVICLHSNKVADAEYLVPVYLHGIRVGSGLSFMPLCKACMDEYPNDVSKDHRATGIPVICLQVE